MGCAMQTKLNCDCWRERDGNNCRWCGADMGPRPGRLPTRLPLREEGDQLVEYRPRYVGAYSVAQAYGGPEEGGWWYEVASPIASVMLRDDDDPLTVARGLWNAFREDDDGREVWESNADNAVVIMWEDRPGCNATTARPSYS